MKKYNKLVRDRVPEIIKRNGDKPKCHIADEKEYFEKLLKKLDEEMKEFLENPSEEELADLLEVHSAFIDYIVVHYGLKRKIAEEIQKKKARTHGRFKKRIILEES